MKFKVWILGGLMSLLVATITTIINDFSQTEILIVGLGCWIIINQSELFMEDKK